MNKLRPRRPSASMIVAIIALTIALGGTSYAAFSLPANSVGSKQLKKNAVVTKKIKNGAVTASKINPAGLTVPKATNATNATNASNLGGKPASAYARSTVARFLTVNSDGTVDASRSTTSATVTHTGTGTYCINGLSPAPTSVVIGQTFGADVGSTNYAYVTGGGCQISVENYFSSSPSDEPFDLAIG